MARYVVNVNDPAAPTDTQGATQGAEEIRALKLKLQAAIAGALIVSSAGANPADCTNLVYPDINDRPAMVAGGWKPWNLNQQWGGAGCMPFHMVDGATGVEYKFDASDCFIDRNTASAIGAAAANYYRYQVYTPGKSGALNEIWLPLYKVANPVDNVTVQLWTMVAGVPGALLATATVINGKQIVSGDGVNFGIPWYRFVFVVPQAVVAGTQYAIVVFKSGGADAVNFYGWTGITATKYPNNLQGVGTIVPAWTATNTSSNNFIAVMQASDQPIQSAGVFDGRIVGSGTGNPVNRSVGYCNELKNFFPLFNPNGWSIRLGGKSWNKDCTIFDAMYGLHHDRINVRCAVGTGATTVTVYKQDGTIVTLNGTSDISSAAYKDIWVVGRSMGDGGDYLRIYVGTGGIWSKETEVVGQTFTFDPLMLKQGTAWLMGGFQLFGLVNYTNMADMSVLPSGAPGYAFTTSTGTVEANVFAISGGKLNQIKAGMAAGGDGYYSKAALAFNNANGWAVILKNRIVSSTNSNGQPPANIEIYDGTKVLAEYYQEYFSQSVGIGVAVINNHQIDNKSVDNVKYYTAKGSDFFIFCNGKLLEDGTGKHTAATGANQIFYGDRAVGANENADVCTDYLGYYNTANIYPQFTSGELHEFACFSGEKGNLGQALYNGGIPLSVKQYCGIGKNYVGEQIVTRQKNLGVTNAPQTVVGAFALIAEMEHFVLGANIDSGLQLSGANSGANNTSSTIYLDGAVMSIPGVYHKMVNATETGAGINDNARPFFGLHKVEGRSSTNAGTTTWTAQQRSFSSRVSAF